MKNWLGQDVEVGNWVYRGARDGNTSTFKIGKVLKVNTNGNVRVEWYAEPVTHLQLIDKFDKIIETSWVTRSGYWRDGEKPTGTSGIDTMVVIDDAVGEAAAAKAEILRNAHDFLPHRNPAGTINTYFKGYIEKEAFDEYVQHELAARGITA